MALERVSMLTIKRYCMFKKIMSEQRNNICLQIYQGTYTIDSCGLGERDSRKVAKGLYYRNCVFGSEEINMCILWIA